MSALDRLGSDLLKNGRRMTERRRLRPPRLTVRPHRGSDRTVWFLVPDWDRPAGGLATIYRHVDLLNANGIPAAAVHHRPGFRLRWFDNETRIVSGPELGIAADDVVVVPEVWPDAVAAIPYGVRHVVFDQSGHLAWGRSGAKTSCYTGRNDCFVGVLTVSAHSRELLRHALPSVPVSRVHLSVDPRFEPPAAAPRRIAYMPRRGSAHLSIALDILRSRRSVGGWEVLPLVDVPFRRMPAMLRSAQVFVTTSELEGFGLPAAEAMATGCYVVGYDGFGGREFFLPSHSSPVPSGDVFALARALEDVLAHSDQWRVRRGLLASAFIRRTFSAARERDDVVRYYGTVLEASEPWTRGPASWRRGPSDLVTT